MKIASIVWNHNKRSVHVSAGSIRKLSEKDIMNQCSIFKTIYHIHAANVIKSRLNLWSHNELKLDKNW